MNNLLEDIREATGFQTAFECFDWLVRIEKHRVDLLTITKHATEKIVFGKAIAIPERKYILDVNQVKEAALMEIYHLLPLQDEKNKLMRCIGRDVPNWMIQEGKEILTKIPTK